MEPKHTSKSQGIGLARPTGPNTASSLSKAAASGRSSLSASASPAKGPTPLSSAGTTPRTSTEALAPPTKLGSESSSKAGSQPNVATVRI